MKRWGVLVLSLFVASVGFAANFDYTRKWQTIKTEHFFIRYPKEIETTAQDAARILEEVHATLSPKLNWKPWGRTEVILTDSTDDANGMTMVLPYNWLLLFVAQPRPDSSLSNYDDWLRTLIIHEYTHLLTIDPARGFWKPFRMIFGKTTAPYGLVPGWVREGFSVYEETEQTTAGRNRSTFSDMMVRTSILEDKFPKIDEADGLGWSWPSYNTAYIFGGKFVKYLVDTYGEDKFLEFNRRVQSSPMLSMVNHQARNVYHKTFYELWREWEAKLKEEYGSVETKIETEGLTTTESVILPKWDEQFASPAPSPDSSMLAYVVTSPHRAAEIQIKDMETGDVRDKIKAEANKVVWSPDGKKIAYTAIGSYKRFNRYFDLWLYDIEKGKKKRLTTGQRARDPDFDPTGKEIVFVTGSGGTDVLKKIDIGTKEITPITEPSPEYAHYANPKFSPDGQTIAADTWNGGEGWKIYLYSLNGSSKKRLTAGKGAENYSSWSPDGKYVYYSSDETGVSNIYRTGINDGAKTKVTNVLTGVFDPSSRDGRKFYIREYRADGFVISSFDAGGAVQVTPPPPKKKGPAFDIDAPGSLGEGGEDVVPQKYSPFGKSLFLPRFITPWATYLEDAFLFSIMTGGSDPLRWHNWIAGGTYRTDAKYFGYYGGYWYNRWLPVLGLGINDYAVDFGDLTFVYPGGQTNTVHYFEQRRNANAFIYIPVKKHSFNVSYFYEDRMPITSLTPAEKDVLNLGVFAGFTGTYLYNDTEKYPASISPENGRMIRLTGMVTDSIFGGGSRNEQIIFSGDWREYVRLWHHHVLALRAAGGIQWGDRQVQGTFGLGGAIGEGTLGGSMSYNYFPLRGLTVSALSRTRAMVMSTEYRLPIVSPQRGVGTWPFYLKNFYAAFFADYGNAWNADENEGDGYHFFQDFMLGVGTELRGDFVIGHGLPLTARLGYGIIVLNRDRLGDLTDPILNTSLKDGILILQFGTSF